MTHRINVFAPHTLSDRNLHGDSRSGACSAGCKISEIRPDNCFVFLNVEWPTFRDSSPTLENVNTLSYGHDHAHVVFYNQHTAAEGSRNRGDHRDEIVAFDVGHSRRGFIKKNKRRGHNKCPSDTNATLIRIGENSRQLTCFVADAKPSQNFNGGLSRSW
jgi:hypothetical protein